MASGTFYSDWVFGEGSYRIAVQWSESDQSDANNKSRVNAKVGFVAGWDISIGSRTPTISINGNSDTVSFSGASGTGTFWSTSRWVDVTHNSDGSKSINISASFYVNATISGAGYIGTVSASSTVTLGQLDRIAPTITSQAAYAENQISLAVSATANATCDLWRYSLDNGAWTDFSNAEGTSATGSVAVSENTHTIKLAGRKKTNQLWGIPNEVINIDTRRSSVDFSVSDIKTDEITISATATYECDQWWYSIDNGDTWVSFSTTSGTSESITIEDLTVNTSYAIKIRVRRAENLLISDSATKNVKTQGGIVHVKINNSWKDALAYVKVGNSWKQAIIYSKVGDSWRIGT